MTILRDWKFGWIFLVPPFPTEFFGFFFPIFFVSISIKSKTQANTTDLGRADLSKITLLIIQTSPRLRRQ